MKRPAFQFYPNDWISCPELRACSLAARGLWMEMICIMHQGSPYGSLTLHKKDILPPVLARMIGAETAEIDLLLTELEHAQVFSRTASGTIISRRMQRDERIRRARARGGEKSQDHPNVPQRKGKKGYPSDYPSAQTKDIFPSKSGVSPSSSSSSSSSFASSSLPAGERERPAPAVGISLKVPEGLSGHPAVVLYWERFRLVPAIPAQERMESVIGDDLDGWKENLDYWQGNGHRPESAWKMIDRYEEQAGERRRANGKSKPSIYDPAEQERLKASGAHLYPDGFYRPY